MHASVDPIQKQHRNDDVLGMSMTMNSLIVPTRFGLLNESVMVRSALRDTQTSTTGSRTSRRWDAGSRKPWEDARDPRRRLRRERTERKRMSPRAGRRKSLRAQRYMKERDVWAKMDVRAKGSRVSYTFPVHNSGQKFPRSHISCTSCPSTVWHRCGFRLLSASTSTTLLFLERYSRG